MELKTIQDQTKTGMVFEHIRTNGASTIKQTIVSSMNNDGLTVSVSQLNKVSEYVESPLF